MWTGHAFFIHSSIDGPWGASISWTLGAVSYKQGVQISLWDASSCFSCIPRSRPAGLGGDSMSVLRTSRLVSTRLHLASGSNVSTSSPRLYILTDTCCFCLFVVYRWASQRESGAFSNAQCSSLPLTAVSGPAEERRWCRPGLVHLQIPRAKRKAGQAAAD